MTKNVRVSTLTFGWTLFETKQALDHLKSNFT